MDYPNTTKGIIIQVVNYAEKEAKKHLMTYLCMLVIDVTNPEILIVCVCLIR